MIIKIIYLPTTANDANGVGAVVPPFLHFFFRMGWVGGSVHRSRPGKVIVAPNMIAHLS